MFVENFAKFESHVDEDVRAAGPDRGGEPERVKIPAE